MKPSQVARHRPQHVMVFGDPGTGKSTLVADLLKEGYNLTWISLDNGHNVLFKLGLTNDFLDEHLNIIILPDTKEQPVAAKTCLRIISGKSCKICDKHGQVDCSVCSRQTEATWSVVDVSSFGPKDIIVFDHLGQLANSVMNAIFIKEKKTEEDKPEWDNYFVQGSIMEKFLLNIQQATYNVVCITHVCETEMEDGSKKLVPLIGTTNFSRNSGKYFDHIIYCHILNKEHKFGSSTRYQNKIISKSREDIEIEKEKVPSLKKFFDGSIAEPELAGAKAAEKVLSTSAKLRVVDNEALDSLVTKVEEKLTDIRPPESMIPIAAETASTVPEHLTKPTDPVGPTKSRLELLKELQRRK